MVKDFDIEMKGVKIQTKEFLDSDLYFDIMDIRMKENYSYKEYVTTFLKRIILNPKLKDEDFVLIPWNIAVKAFKEIQTELMDEKDFLELGVSPDQLRQATQMQTPNLTKK